MIQARTNMMELYRTYIKYKFSEVHNLEGLFVSLSVQICRGTQPRRSQSVNLFILINPSSHRGHALGAIIVPYVVRAFVHVT